MGSREGEARAINSFITQHCATRCQAVAQSGCRILLVVLMAVHMHRHRHNRCCHPSTAFILASATNAQNSPQSLTCNRVWVSAAQPPAAHQWDQSFVLWSCSSSLSLPLASPRPFSSAPPTKPLRPPPPNPLCPDTQGHNRHLSHLAVHKLDDSDKYSVHWTAADIVDTEPSSASLLNAEHLNNLILVFQKSS